MKRVLATILLLSTFSGTQALAYTGAEFLQERTPFAAGYAWGVVETLILVADGDQTPVQKHRQTCLVNAHLNSNTFAEVVRKKLRDNPDLLAAGAIGAIIKSLNDICGSGPE